MKPAKPSAAPGTGTATPARVAIPTPTSIASPGTSSCCKSGNGPSATPSSPEILRYLEHVAKRHDLKRDMQFNTRVTGAEFDEETNLWTVRTDKGEEVTARYLIAAVGSLSHTNMPQFKGLEKFKGTVVPHQPLPSHRR